MTALQLLSGIGCVLLLELMTSIGVIRWKRRRDAAATAAGRESPAATPSLWRAWSDLHLVRREVLPFVASLVALGAAALALDALLHLFGILWVGRYLGIAGTLLILGSLTYSLRKRKIIATGKPLKLLRLHEALAWAGSLLVLVHAGVHFNALLGWLAIWAMLITVGSGLTGKFLLERARRSLQTTRQELTLQGVSVEQIDERLYWDGLTLDLVKQWRVVHTPITLAFAVLATAHIVSVFLFWGWH
jgi:hypothetical protein